VVRRPVVVDASMYRLREWRGAGRRGNGGASCCQKGKRRRQAHLDGDASRHGSARPTSRRRWIVWMREREEIGLPWPIGLREREEVESTWPIELSCADGLPWPIGLREREEVESTWPWPKLC
jgi:hypothetical protein